MTNFMYIVEMIGIVSFAISGALEGIKNKTDILGIMILAVVTATGGGIIRDVILGIHPPLTLQNGELVIVASVTAIIVFIAHKINQIGKVFSRKQYRDLLIYVDALGLAVFTINGMNYAQAYDPSYRSFLLIFIGLITGVGGGVIRDTLINKIPFIMDRHVYASAAIVGAVLYRLLTRDGFMNNRIAMIISVVLIFTIRYLSYKKEWNLPKVNRPITEDEKNAWQYKKNNILLQA